MVERKMECGKDMVVLGIQVKPNNWGVRLQLDDAKRQKYLGIVQEAIKTNSLSKGAASKLAGS